MKNPLFNTKSVIKGSYKANVRAGAGAAAKTFWKSEPERKQKSFGSTTLVYMGTRLGPVNWDNFISHKINLLHGMIPFYIIQYSICIGGRPTR